MPRLVVACIALCSFALPAVAQSGGVRALYDALAVPEVVEIMAEEGIAYGATIEEDLFPGRGGAAWSAVVARIYTVERMDADMLERFTTELEGVDVAPLLAFFESDLGKRIVDREMEARRAFMDDELEEAAKVAMLDLQRNDEDRFALLEDFAEINDLVESNVMGAMNSNYAFYQGLMDGSAFGGSLTEQDVLSDVWAQEDQIREDTESWVFSYIALAYQTLSDDDLKAYSALSESREGRALNRALFSAFDAMYNGISRDLGQGAAGFMVGQDI